MRVPLLFGLCAALLLAAVPAMAHADDQGPPNCQPPAPPQPVVHVRHVSRPSCGPVVHRAVHHRRVVRQVVVKKVVIVQREEHVYRDQCDPCARVHEEHWIPLRGPAGGPDWDYITQYEQSLHHDDGDHHQGPWAERDSHDQGMHHEHEWSADCRCYISRRPAATDRLGYLTWPDKTRTWRDQSPDAPPPAQ